MNNNINFLTVWKKLENKKISNKIIDNAYTSAKNAGSLGGKVAGAGGGGFLLLITPSDKKKKVINKLFFTLKWINIGKVVS